MPKTRLAAPTGRYAFYTKPHTQVRGIVDTQQRPGKFETGLYEIGGDDLDEAYPESVGAINVGGQRVRKFRLVGKVIR